MFQWHLFALLVIGSVVAQSEDTRRFENRNTTNTTTTSTQNNTSTFAPTTEQTRKNTRKCVLKHHGSAFMELMFAHLQLSGPPVHEHEDENDDSHIRHCHGTWCWSLYGRDQYRSVLVDMAGCIYDGQKPAEVWAVPNTADQLETGCWYLEDDVNKEGLRFCMCNHTDDCNNTSTSVRVKAFGGWMMVLLAAFVITVSLFNH